MDHYTTLDIGIWKIKLRKPVSVYTQDADDFHITRPNLCRFGNAAGIIFQTTADEHSTPRDHRHVCISIDKGGTWVSVVKNAEINNYSLLSKDDGKVVTLPFESRLVNKDGRGFHGPRSELSWDGKKLDITKERCDVYLPKKLMMPTTTPGMADHYVSDRPFGYVWGTIQKLKDNRWICPGTCCYADQERNPEDLAESACRNTGIYHNFLVTSEDEGYTWNWLCDIACHTDIAGGTYEGPTETHFFEYEDRWRCVFRVNGLILCKPLHFCDSFDKGKTWTKAYPLSCSFIVANYYPPHMTENQPPSNNVDGQIDPRGLITEDGTTVLTTGRPGSDIYLADGTSTLFYKLDMVSHHNRCFPDKPLNTASSIHKNFFPNTGHTDIIMLDDQRLLFTYDRIPDGWRWKTRKDKPSVFTAPDEIFAAVVEIERK